MLLNSKLYHLNVCMSSLLQIWPRLISVYRYKIRTFTCSAYSAKFVEIIICGCSRRVSKANYTKRCSFSTDRPDEDQIQTGGSRWRRAPGCYAVHRPSAALRRRPCSALSSGREERSTHWASHLHRHVGRKASYCILHAAILAAPWPGGGAIGVLWPTAAT